MSNSHAYITLPKGYTAFMSGVATAGWMQQVIVNHETTGGQPISSCTFQGLATPMVITAGASGFADQQAFVITDNNDDSQLEIVFSAFDGQTTATGEASPILNYKRDKYNSSVADWVTTYIYRTEDGGDNDEHDTTFVVTVIKNTKDVAPAPSDPHGGSGMGGSGFGDPGDFGSGDPGNFGRGPGCTEHGRGRFGHPSFKGTPQ